MHKEPTIISATDADREKQAVAFSSLLAAVLLTGTKLGIGIWTNSLGILSEAAHSGLDLVAAGVTLWAVRVSGRPADREHPYGHGKIENLSALFETLLLLVTCIWIIYEACKRLFFAESVEVDVNLWAFGVVIMSIVIDFSRSRALRRVADKHSSQALHADALHFSTDIWSSAVVLLGLVGIVASEYFNLPWLISADSVAALAVAGIVIWVSYRLGKESVDDLLDAVPDGLQDKVTQAASEVSGVEGVSLVRLRRSGPDFFADITIAVSRAEAFERAHEIAHRTEEAVLAVLPSADVVVHFEPTASASEDPADVVRLLAARRRVGAHQVRVSMENGRPSLDFHLEVDPSLSLDEAHRQASEFEHELHLLMPQLNRVVTHIEPDSGAVAKAAQPAGRSEVQEAVRDFLGNARVKADTHNLHVQWYGDELAVSLHLTLDPAIPITEAHAVAASLEDYIRHAVANVGRVVIHVEPSRHASA